LLYCANTNPQFIAQSFRPSTGERRGASGHALGKRMKGTPDLTEPVIFHVDMDAFFVSVEELFDPSLKHKAVIVGGAANQRGVVLAASYEARKFGVHSAMPLVTASQLCPHAIFLPGHQGKYVDYSRRLEQILSAFTPIVEMVSIDEAYLDFAGSSRLYGSLLSLAHHLRGEIERKTGLSASIGISRTKTVSKVASDLAKPRGILFVFPGHEATLLGPLKVGKLPGIGKATEARLHDLGITTAAQLASIGQAFLSELFGHWGESLYCKSQGLDTAHFEFHEEPKSISHEHTFDHDTADFDHLHATLTDLVVRTAHRLRDHKMLASTITLKLRDLHFQTIHRAVSLNTPTQLDRDIRESIFDLLKKNWDGRQIRLLGVALSGLTYGPVQGHLFQKESRDKLTRLYQAADKVRDKFGFDSITSARIIQ
jgi:DNA polymerase IV